MSVRLKWFRQMYPRSVVEQIRRKIPKEERYKGVIYYLTARNPAAKLRRIEFNKFLEVAFRHKALDADLTARLRSPKWDQFIQAHNELLVAYFFESVAKFNIVYRPAGAGRSVGEFMLQSGKDEIFVEVKSPYRETPEAAWCGSDRSVVRECVRRAYRQIPKTGQKTLVVFSGKLSIPISEPQSGIIQALYGDPIIAVPLSAGTVGKPQPSWIRNGLFQPNQQRSLSAVATLEQTITDEYLDSVFLNMTSGGAAPINSSASRLKLDYVLRIYHNPYARAPIDKKYFPGVSQFAPAKDGAKLEWLCIPDTNQNGRAVPEPKP
jgi:hypothetical protein